jgi:phage tail-like protein
MALSDGEVLTSYSFQFSIDGQNIPNVVEVNNIQQQTSTIESKSMSPSGGYVIQQMLGPRQSGTLQVTVLASGDPSVTQWFLAGLSGDFKGARKTAVLAYLDTYGAPVQTVEFQNVMVTGVSYGALKAGEAQGINMTLTMTFTDMTIG